MGKAVYSKDTKIEKATAAKDFGTTVPAHPEYCLSIEDAQEKLKNDSNFRLVSVRSEAEFKGETSGYIILIEQVNQKVLYGDMVEVIHIIMKIIHMNMGLILHLKKCWNYGKTVILQRIMSFHSIVELDGEQQFLG
jgi:hypothetical protein